jgi:dolichol-phosphate mannosyltransferase
LIAKIRLECHRFEFCPEMTAKLCRMGEKIAEVPIRYAPRSAGEGKKIRHSDGWLAIWTLLRYRFGGKTQWTKAATAEDKLLSPFPVSSVRLPLE